ncbi:glycosyl transferase family 1 [Leptospira sarikeiensis]|nr:glycosyl transferase family 1 [Leptospira sarikeiensis]
MDVKFLEKPSSPSSLAHFHIGNSGRELLISASKHKTKAIVTLHDILPRDKILRFIMGRLQLFSLRKHALVVHSEYSKKLAAKFGYNRPIEVVPMGPHPLEDLADQSQNDLSLKSHGKGSGKTLRLCQPGVAKKAKALPELIEAISNFPEITLVIAGGIKDKLTRDFIQKYQKPNLIVLGYCDDEVLNQEIRKSDYVTCFRVDSVGEANGPLVLSHYLGIPIVGWSIGSIPEYALDGDRIFPENTPIAKILKTLLEEDRSTNVRPGFLREQVMNYWDVTFDRYREIYSKMGWI